MKAKREAPTRRTNGRAGGQGGVPRGARRRTGDVAPAHHNRKRAPKASATAGDDRQQRRSGPQTAPIPRPVERTARPKSARQAKARARARKAKAPKVIRPRLRDRLVTRLVSIDLRPRTLAAKVPFVVLVIGSLGVGLGLTLWLSTDSAERSYQLGNARERNRMLQQQKEALERDVREAASAPALAEAARNQGMIPSRDTAHLVQDPQGSWVVVGTPKPADGVPPPPLNTKLPDASPAPPPPPANPVEVPVPVPPRAGAANLPARSGPEVLTRAPDGSTTLGAQHLPTGTGPQAPGIPGGQVVGPVPGLTMPATLPGPGGVPPAGEPVPPLAAPEPVTQPAPPLATGRAGTPPAAPADGLATGEQFGPITVATPGAAR